MKNHVGKLAAITAIAFLGFVTSCSKNEETLGAQDAADASSQSQADAYYEDAGDLSIDYIQNVSPAKLGRVATDNRLSCATITLDTVTETKHQQGTITINFGAGCQDAKGNIRKGVISLAYSNGPAGQTGFTVVETFTDYYINGIELEGVRTFTREESPAGHIKHHVVLDGGMATWPDATFATRNGNHHRDFNLTDSTLTITGTTDIAAASGTNRHGKEYSVEITKALVHKLSCAKSAGIYMPVEGTEVITSNGKSITIDFGSGDCDRKVTVTVGKISKEITLGTN